MERTTCSRIHARTGLLFVVFSIVLTSRQGVVRGVGVLEFSVEPRDVSVSAGGSAVLDCAAQSSDHNRSKIMIQWQDEHGQPVTFIGDTYRSQLTNNSLYVSRVADGETAGVYQCRASLPNGWSVVSRRARVEVARLGAWEAEPGDVTVRAGGRAYLACRPATSAARRTRWLKDGRPLHVDELRMAVLPGGALEIDGVQPQDAGTYRCNVSVLEEHALSRPAHVAITSGVDDDDDAGEPTPPRFVAVPRDARAVEGDTITLDCSADGRPQPRVAWLKDGRAIDLAHLDTRYSTAGATGGALQVSDVREGDAGTYTCRADNGEDSADAAAELRVLVPPRFVRRPQDRLGQLNADTEFRCEVYGRPEPRVVWLKNSETITYNDYLTLVNGHDLRITGLIDDDTGIFQCVAANEAGNVQASARLKVIGQPEHNKRKKARPFLGKKPGKSFSHNIFSSLVSGGGGVDPHAVFTSLRSDGQQSLGPALTAFTDRPADVGDVAAEELVPARPQDLRAVIVKARFVTLSWRSAGDDVTAYSVYWRQEGSPRERVHNTTRSKLEEANIGGLIPGRVYLFRVVAHNTHGAGPSSDQLSVATQGEEHVPSAPQHVHAHATGASSVRVQWQPPHTTNGALRGYRLYYMDPDGGVERSADVPPTVESHELTGLTPYTEYGVWLAAVNSNGAGASSRDISVRTYGAAPGDPPYNVTVEPAGATALVVRWEPPPRDALNGVVTGYKLRYRRVGRRGDTITTAGDARSHTLTDLDRSSTYQIRLSAINTNGSGPATDWLSADTYDNEPDESTVPSEPSPLRVRPTSDSIHVSWSPPGTGTTPARNVHVRKYILGWGKGIPDYFAHELDEKTRQYTIANLEPNSEYVISLRASNSVGPGPARYANVRTRDDQPPEPQLPLMPPVGLKAQVLSSSTVVLYWTDATLSKSQYATDQRHYVVRYEAVVSSSATKQRTYNATELNCMITDLRPNTQYEFTVKVVKGRRESPWSMVVTNTTYPSAPGTAPRDLSVAQDGAAVRLAWQPPKLTNGPITGYVIFYTTDASRRDRDWLVEGVLGDRHATLIHGLRPDQHYVFKIQARNSKGVGPFSATAALRTSHGTGVVSHDSRYKDGKGGVTGVLSGNVPLYLVIGGSVVGVTVLAVLITVFCCRRGGGGGGGGGDAGATPDRAKKAAYLKGQGVKPPDLWIHHDQMELKALDKSGGGGGDGASSSGAVTLPRSVAASEYEATADRPPHTNSLDKRTYMAGYMAIATGAPLNPVGELPRPAYPRTQYTMSRAHVTLDQQPESPYAPAQHYEPPSGGYGLTGSYAAGVSVLPPPVVPVPAPDPAKRPPGHPLKSFSVPAPPPTSAPGTPQPKHVVSPAHIVRPAGSPYKKLGAAAGASPSRISASNPPPHTADEVQRLAPSQSTEELNQEMANLEGLMKDLSAITASQFEC